MLMRPLLVVTWTVALASSCAPARPARTPAMPIRDDAISVSDPASAPAPAWPPTRREDITETLHGTTIRDPYRWLEDGASPEVQAWVAAQDRFARERLAELPERARLRDRIAELSAVERMSAPERRGQRYFYDQLHPGKDKPIYYVREGDTEPRVLLDPNTLEGVSVLASVVSPDGAHVAFRISRNNTDDAQLEVLDVATGAFLELDTIPDVRFSKPSWTARGDGFYYTRMPPKGALDLGERIAKTRVYLHRLGTPYTQDEAVFEEAGDPRVLLGAEASRDGNYVFVYKVHGWDSTEVFVRDLRKRGRSFRPLIASDNARSYVAAFRDRIYVHTNYGAERWRILRMDPKHMKRGPAQLEALEEVVPEDPEAVLSGWGIAGGHLWARYLRDAATELKVLTLDGELVRRIELPALGSSEGLVAEDDQDEAYYAFESFLEPPTIYKTSVREGGASVYARPELPASAEPYAVTRQTFRSRDGTEVGMFVVGRRELPRDGATPWLLIGYGGFNVSVVPRFDGALYAWLEAGGAVAYVNARGGGERGEAWHRAGMLDQKQNTFDDFIAAAEHLVAEGYARPSRLAMWGGSNGGLLVAAVMTQRPELFSAVICQVPLTDMLRYHRYGAAKGWTRELGSPDDPAQLAVLSAYSPYHRVREGVSYPALLVLSAAADDRVDPMHARKLTAAVQHATAGARPVLMRVESNAGHAGAGLVRSKIELEADAYAFLLRSLGVH